MEETKLIWLDGRLTDWAEAKVHVLTHTLHYGLGVFEGIRCYETARGPAIFRLPEHVRRFFDSAKIAGFAIPYSPEQVSDAIRETVKANGMRACYIRPLAFLGYGVMGLNHTGAPVRVAVAVWPWGAYLGAEGLKRGIRVKIASFTAHHANVTMTKAKICGNYAVAQLAKMEAIAAGYDEAILLDAQGNVTQGSGENIFIVRHGVLKTPPITSVLEGITRASVLALARERGVPVVEEPFARDELYIADEAFFTGTAAEVTPIREVDGRAIGPGKVGPVTARLQGAFFDVVQAKDATHQDWLTFV
ncbi:MAG: branched-chain amino acid transaminase [Candidatus Methylomirabilales bacterium]